MTARHFLFSLLVLAATLLAQADEVLPGIDVLERDGFRQLAGAHVALITNHTGLSRDGRSTIRLLHEAPNVDLVRIFSPEHGIEGKLDIPLVDDGTDGETGIPVISLYGETRRPTTAMLAGVDTIVFDIQDIGTRFYTYISTMGGAMVAAAEHDVRFVVLDRPNPINGIDVAGPVLDDGLQSFVGFHAIPIRHGMTVGELAKLFESELALDLDLRVVRVGGWRRDEYFDDTGLTWINPSPNMRSLRAALLYPGIGLLETTNLSVGRGTDTPFELLATPAAFGAIEVDASVAKDLLLGTADVSNAFYGLEVPDSLGKVLALPAVRARHLGLSWLDGLSVGGDTMIQPYLRVLPMGWNWALHFCQSAVTKGVSRLLELTNWLSIVAVVSSLTRCTRSGAAPTSITLASSASTRRLSMTSSVPFVTTLPTLV